MRIFHIFMKQEKIFHNGKSWEQKIKFKTTENTTKLKQ